MLDVVLGAVLVAVAGLGFSDWARRPGLCQQCFPHPHNQAQAKTCGLLSFRLRIHWHFSLILLIKDSHGAKPRVKVVRGHSSDFPIPTVEEQSGVILKGQDYRDEKLGLFNVII